METVGFRTGTSLCETFCLIPSVADVGVNEATALMAVVDPSTTVPSPARHYTTF